ncbi:MAG: ammonium transporter [Chloroflexi bacterium]|nr:ammonium transporter [Chloroflexota bacterium]
MLAFSAAGTALAQGEQPPDVQAVADTASDTATSLNVMWVLIAGFLVFFMQAGFALVETGFTRNKNVVHTMMMNMMVFCIGAVGYWLTGFALQFGGVNYTYPAIGANPEWAFSPVTLGNWSGSLTQPLLIGGSGVAGLTGFMLGGLGANFGVLTFFMFQMVFMDTAATIPTGSMAERLKFVGFALMGMWVSMFIYPIVGNWVWGGGWLANLGRSAGLGNGAVDFAGSGVVHMIGGAVGLAGAIVIGPRIGRFNKDGSANTIPAHNIPMGILGTIILFFGWFGFNPGSALGFTGAFRNLAVLAAINTLMAGAAGGVSAMMYMWLRGATKKPDPSMSVNGVLAGLVAITAPCAFVDTTAAVVIGLVAGVWVCVASVILEKLKIDDPVGAVPVHFANGLWGVLAVGIFANGNPDTAAWNGVATPVTGLLYGNASQFLAQVAEAGAIAVTVVGLSYVFFKVLDALKLLRVSREVELEGLDMPEMGALGYPKDFEPGPDAVIYSRKTAKSAPIRAGVAAGK